MELVYYLHGTTHTKIFPESYSWFSCDVRKKLKLKVLSFYLYQVKAIFKNISVGLSSARQTVLFLKIEDTEHGFFTTRDIGTVSGQYVMHTKILICLIFSSSK